LSAGLILFSWFIEVFTMKKWFNLGLKPIFVVMMIAGVVQMLFAFIESNQPDFTQGLLTVLAGAYFFDRES
jgi:FtsH-binding integral membrane protein